MLAPDQSIQGHTSAIAPLAVAMPRVRAAQALQALFPAREKHQTAQVVLDLLVLAAAYLLAYELRFDFAVPPEYRQAALETLPFVLAVQYTALAFAGVYSFAWRYVGMSELPAFASAATMAAVPLLVVRFGPWGSDGAVEGMAVPLSVIAIDSLLAFSTILGLRVAGRMASEHGERSRSEPAASTGKPVLLVGAGWAGINALRALQRRGDGALCPVGFVDDDHHKRGLLVHGVPVLGTTADLPELVRSLHIDQVVITIARASRKQIRKIVDICERIPVKVRIVPGLFELLKGDVEATIRNVNIEDLLGRQPVALDQERLTHFLRGKRVMITGAGGSIGSEICRQVARFGPDTLILVERCEFALFSIDRELRAAYPDLTIIPRLADVGDPARMREVFARQRPHVVLHAAAHKHVPLMEDNPCEAVKNNIFGTKTTGELAGEYGAEIFVLVSTDKAVRPTSVMGATKRIAELVTQQLGKQYPTHYIAVRFGNVLGSTGSVVPIFREQIARGGPVTVTHPDMVRYFMTIPEAAQLVLQAGAMRKGGEIFVLDMGEPVRIVDLATDMIRLCGLKLEDVELVFSGIRPGEKMYEELSNGDEALARTHHPKIFSGKLTPMLAAEFRQELETLAALAWRGDDAGVRRQLARLIPDSQLTLPGAAAIEHPASESRRALAQA